MLRDNLEHILRVNEKSVRVVRKRCAEPSFRCTPPPLHNAEHTDNDAVANVCVSHARLP